MCGTLFLDREKLVSRDFDNKYKNLKDKLLGSIDLSIPNIILDIIENS